MAIDIDFPVKFLEDKLEFLKTIDGSIITPSAKLREKYSDNLTVLEVKLKQYDTALKVLKLIQNNDSAVQALSVFLDLL